MAREFKSGDIVKHFKGNQYQILTFGLDANTSQTVVIYMALYGDNQIWVRPLLEFGSKVDKNKYPDATQEFRFEIMSHT